VSTINSITYDDAIPVTPDDTTNDPAGPFAGFHTGSGGTIVVRTVKGTVRALPSLPAGIIFPLAIMRVNATGTTATGVLGMVALPYKRPGPS